jgi:pyruvate/2-oxoglutarate dehydrogenase complex dihydrolipoamide dehydrogenase (E3) component
LPIGETLVFISARSHFAGYPGSATYAASKDGLHACASSLSVNQRDITFHHGSLMRDLPDAALPDGWPSLLMVAPPDAANATLVRNVAPAAWVSPKPKEKYHLVVVGAGTAGLVSAAIAVGLGARVALVERHLFGGDCLNFGCVPSKAFIRAARAWADARRAAETFGGPSTHADADFARAMLRMRELRAELSEADSVERFHKLGVDVFLGEASFSDPTSLMVGNDRLRFRRAIIATGARAARPNIPGLSDTPYHTNESIFSLTALPRRMVVVGGGPIGAELAQAFARYGTAVTIANSAPHVLPREDQDAAVVVAHAMERDGVRIMNDARVERVAHDGAEFRVSVAVEGKTSELLCDALLVATGRTANTEGLQLEKAGVAHTKKGVTVDDRYRTSNKAVYAIGDISSGLQFTHVADAQARFAVANALFFGIGGGKNSTLVPRATFTSPEVAHVGKSVSDAAEQGLPIETVRVNLFANDRSVLEDDTSGFLKVHLKKGTDTIVGATLVAAHAGEMIGELGLAITNGVGLGAIGKTIHAYPTQSDVFRKAADMWRRGRLTPRAKQLFAWWFRIFD